MDSYTNASSSSSYSNSSNSSPDQFPSQYQKDERSRAYRSALHSVRKIPAKNTITKKPIAPMPPIPPKIYKVDPVDFRDVVQRLTAGPQFQRRRLKEVAPPPLSLSSPQQLPVTGKSSQISPLGFSLSPSSLAWCSSMLLSPQTLSSLEPSTVL